ncbi:ribonuclease H2 subunit A [Raphidocelis subcapitata]|uniref:Ribonuclease n=1 Tax=Raphidocelis subcapitata TaxID=307507 RepID=A0A2V0P1G4_9CHLO|nr:ribonuclease H2 subunit A [Raphidocelis subcapitata]|eukprot:GBF93409.1 ribonuclease H2 subunit A [Raphidocelis subcapitata]
MSQPEGAQAGAPDAGARVAPPTNMVPPREWFGEPCLMGIDEAGRGPVLGCMVYACVVAPISYGPTLAKKAYADSKTLTEAQRAGLFAQITADERLAYAHEALSAAVISQQMLGRAKVSLNEIAAQSTMRLIQGALDAGVALAEVYIDTVGDPERYRARLLRAFPSLAFTVCPKADALFPSVSAASIVAKVTRDASLLDDQARLPARAQPAGGSLGTGYPHDEATKGWLAANVDPVFGFHPIVRFGWETASRIMEDRCAPMAWEADAPTDANQPKLSAFLPGGGGGGGAADASSGVGRHAFFRIRRMQRVAALA